MDSSDKLKNGYWAVATEKHLKSFTSDSPHLDEVDNLNIAGKSGRFLGAIRGSGKIENIKRLEKMANNIGIRRRELHTIILPEIELGSDKKVELIRNTVGEIIGIAEYMFDSNTTLSIAGQIFENSDPTVIERVTIATMDETKKIPYYQDDLLGLLTKKGYSEQDVMLAIAIQEQFKMVERFNFSKNPNPIISNEYVWGENHKKMAGIITGLDLGQRQTLKEIIESIQSKQGVPYEMLPKVEQDILNLAKKTGMISPTIISSSRGIDKEFEFTADAFMKKDTYNDDILDDVKLLLASIRFGEHYTEYSTINDPIDFLSALIRHGEVGPHAANKTDYTLLEARGIVKVTMRTKPSYYGGVRSGYCLQLIRKDVAEEALRIIRAPEYNFEFNNNSDKDYGTVLESGTFLSPEESRLKVAELLQPMKEAQEYLSKVLRDELI